MKNFNLRKVATALILCMAMIFNCSAVVFAADNSISDTPDKTSIVGNNNAIIMSTNQIYVDVYGSCSGVLQRNCSLPTGKNYKLSYSVDYPGYINFLGSSGYGGAAYIPGGSGEVYISVDCYCTQLIFTPSPSAASYDYCFIVYK